MAQAANPNPDGELVDRFEEFFRRYYSDEVGELARQYPREQKSLTLEWGDLYKFDTDLADDYLQHPDQLQQAAEEALRLYDLPIDVSLGQAHVRVEGLEEYTEIRDIRAENLNTLVGVQGMVRKATDVKPKIREAVFVCQRCGHETVVPQADAGFQEPYQCESCERQGPFKLNAERSEFVDSQKLRIQESPEGLAGGETPQSIDVHVEDDITGEVTPGDHVTTTGVLRLDQSEAQNESPIFDVYLDGVSVVVEDEEFEEMDITDEDKREIIEISDSDSLYEDMVDSMAPAIYGHRQAKLAMILQLFSGVTKNLPDGSRIRGDLHMLLIGDPGTGKCVSGDTRVTLADGTERPIRELVEENLDEPKPIDDGVCDDAEIALPGLDPDSHITEHTATRVWKREAPESLYRVRTSSGREVDVTPSHPLFVQRNGRHEAVRAEALETGEFIAVAPRMATDGGVAAAGSTANAPTRATFDRIESIEAIEPEEEWVYDLEVAGVHNYLTNGVVSHNSQMISYIQNIAPRSVYTSGKGSSSAGLTAAAVRDDFGDGQQWTLEAGALVLADQGIAAVDELDKMRCVTGDTLVTLGDGSIERIGDIARDAADAGTVEVLENGRTVRDLGDLSVLTMGDDGRVVERPVTAVHEYDVPEDLTEVTLESGEQLTSTPDHPYFVFEDGERVERGAAELEDGDWVYVPRESNPTASDGGVAAASTPKTAETTTDDTALAAVLGYLSGDGNVYYNRKGGSYGVRFTNSEEELLADFEAASRTAFDGATPVRHPSEQRSDGVETVRVHGKEVADIVLDAGMNLEVYDGKAFPTTISEHGRDSKAAFVRALADSEGTVDTSTGTVKIFSASRELLTGTKEVLRELGVSAQIQTRQRDKKRDLFVLSITSADSIENYRRYVGFTLDRKQAALESICRDLDGSRTILDVIPGIDAALAEARESLRLNQDECGTTAAAYGGFERGEANTSIHRAQAILDAFEDRKRNAKRDYESLDGVSWTRLDELCEKYHVSQAELASGLERSQQFLSDNWGESERVREMVRDRVEEILASVASTDLDQLESLVRGGVKWRRVSRVETASSTALTDDRVQVLENELAAELGCSPEDAVETAETQLRREFDLNDWESVASELERHGISQRAVAERVGINQSTLSRWLTGAVESDRLDEVAAAAKRLIGEKRDRVASLLEEIEDRRKSSVYDLTVEGTHNFVANGMIVHNSEDRSAMHEALEQQKISISKAGINATLKSRCSLLGAANPKYGRFDEYEPIGEQIDLEPALVSRFDLIFTVTDKPDPEEDSKLAKHILQTNYAGELNTQRTKIANSPHTEDEVDAQTEEVAPAIDADLLRKYIAYSRRKCYPTMSAEARQAIEDFYVNLRAKGADEDAPVPVTARKLEGLVRLAEASARVRLSDTVEKEDADRVIEITRSCLQDIGVDPETGEFDADVVETGRSKTQRDRIRNVKGLISDIEDDFDEGAPVDEVLARAEEVGIDEGKAEHEIEKLKKQGEVYEPSNGHLRTT